MRIGDRQPQSVAAFFRGIVGLEDFLQHLRLHPLACVDDVDDGTIGIAAGRQDDLAALGHGLQRLSIRLSRACLMSRSSSGVIGSGDRFSRAARGSTALEKEVHHLLQDRVHVHRAAVQLHLAGEAEEVVEDVAQPETPPSGRW